jgi:hypothetical protein
MTTFQMNDKTYKVVDGSPNGCAGCAFKDDSQSCATVDKFVERKCYDIPQQHYEEVQ